MTLTHDSGMCEALSCLYRMVLVEGGVTAEPGSLPRPSII